VHVRIFSVLVTSLLVSGAAFGAEREVAGTVVDQSGRAVPRAYVSAVDASAKEIAATFSDESGRFHLVVDGEGCRIRASLTGFEPADAPCDAQVRLTLGVAPVREDVIVTATRTEAPASQVGASATAFTAGDLRERRAPLVSDLLRTTPGATIIRTGAPGGVTSLFVRGGESNYNKVLLDGIPLNEPGGTFNFSNLTTDNLDRVEIVRGAQSAIFGSDAMSSVVQLITHRAERGAPPQATGSIEAGTYGSVRGGGSVSGTVRAFEYSAGVSGFATDNNAPNDAFRNTTISGTAGVALGAAATLRVVARTELQHNGTPGQTAFGRPDLDAFFERHDGVGGVTFDGQLTPRVRQRASYSLTVSHQQSTNLIADPPYTPQFGDRRAPFQFTDFRFDSFNNLHRHHASYQADIRLADDG